MQADHHLINDTTIVTMLVEKNTSVWEYIFDKYGTMMFGIISEMTGNQLIAEELFEEAFFQLRKKGIFGYNSTTIRLCIYRYVYSFTTKQLQNRGMEPQPESYSLYDNCRLLKLLWTESSTLKDAGLKLNLTEEQAQKRLSDEFNFLRQQEHSERNPVKLKLVY